MMEYYSTLKKKKKNELASHEKVWWNLKYILLRIQIEKATYCMILTIHHFSKGKTIETIKKISDWDGGGGAKMKRQSTEDF